MTQYNKRYILSTFEKIEIFALSNRSFNKLSNDTKFVKIKVILLKIQVLHGMNFLLFSLYFIHCFAHFLRINLCHINCSSNKSVFNTETANRKRTSYFRLPSDADHLLSRNQKVGIYRNSN